MRYVYVYCVCTHRSNLDQIHTIEIAITMSKFNTELREFIILIMTINTINKRREDCMYLMFDDVFIIQCAAHTYVSVIERENERRESKVVVTISHYRRY